MPPSLFSPVIERSGAAKFYEPVFDDFKPERIRSAEIEARSGRQEQLHNLYQVMMQAWPELQCDVLNMAAQPSRCRWSVVPGSPEGNTPTPRAKEAAETVSRALWSPPHLPTGDVRMSFSELLGSLFYGLCFGVSAYEIEWERTPDDLIVPARYLRLLPQYYGWSSRNDEPDSLLLYPGGTWGTDGKPFPRHKFLVALNRRGPSHPWQNGSFHALLAHFCAYKWGWSWLMSYCQKYGQPIRTFYAYSDKEQQDIQKQLTEKGAVTDIVVRRNGANAAPAMEMMTAGHAAGSIPHEALIERANAACHQLIRGQSMTNEIGRNGSRAQAEVGNDVRLEEVEHVCNYVADIINTQLIPSILELNYGPRHNIPMPELRFEVPGARMNAAALDTYMKARQLGLAVKLSEVYENCGIAQPAEGDEVLEPLEGNPADELFPDEVQAALALDRRRIWKGKEAARRQAEDLAPKVRQDWLRPFRTRLTQMLEEGKTAQDILDAIRSGELSPDTEALSEALHATLLAGFGAGQQESVAAAEGCKRNNHCLNGKVCSCPPKKDDNADGSSQTKSKHKEILHLSKEQIETLKRRGINEEEGTRMLNRERNSAEWRALDSMKRQLNTVPYGRLSNSRGHSANLSSAYKKKVFSNKAINKSNINGYTDEEHARAAADIVSIWRRASYSHTEEPHAYDERGIMEYKRYFSTYRYGRTDYNVLITVKHFYDKKQDDILYSLELLP